MDQLQQYKKISNHLLEISSETTLIVVSKSQPLSNILPIINAGHMHFGENRVQEAILKWKDFVKVNSNIKLHMIGKLQSNKVSEAVKIFDYIHSIDSHSLAKKLSLEEEKQKKKLKYFIQINFNDEQQKSGVSIENLEELVHFVKVESKLDILGFMCIPPASIDPAIFFRQMKEISSSYNLKDLSMGMSNDYEIAIKEGSTFVRIGSKIFS